MQQVDGRSITDIRIRPDVIIPLRTYIETIDRPTVLYIQF